MKAISPYFAVTNKYYESNAVHAATGRGEGV